MIKILFPIILAGMICFVSAQSQSINDLSDGRNNGNIYELQQWRHSVKNNTREHLKKTELFHPESSFWKWDTIFTYDTTGLQSMITQQFDLQGNTLVEKREWWMGNTWINYRKDTFSYDTSGNLLTWVIEGWQSNEWLKYWRYTYTYDATGNKLGDLVEQWQTNTWVNFDRTTYFYDPYKNRLTMMFGEGWGTDGWGNSWVHTYTYDSTGNMSDVYEKWQTYKWENFSKFTYTYDSTGKMLTEVDQAWNSLSPSWVNYSRYTYTYDSDGNLLTELDEVGQYNEWSLYERYTYSYDSNGNRLTQLYENYWPNNAWISFSRNTYSYDANGNMLNDLFEKWQSNAWRYYSRYTYTYDSPGNSTTGKYEIWLNGAWQALTDDLHVFSQKNVICNITMVYRYEAVYTSFLSGIPISRQDQSSFNVYPNPAKDKITLSIQKINSNTSLAMYDMQGKLLLRKSVQNGETEIDISNFTNGLYLLRLSSGNKEITKRILKE